MVILGLIWANLRKKHGLPAVDDRIPTVQTRLPLDTEVDNHTLDVVAQAQKNTTTRVQVESTVMCF